MYTSLSLYIYIYIYIIHRERAREVHSRLGSDIRTRTYANSWSRNVVLTHVSYVSCLTNRLRREYGYERHSSMITSVWVNNPKELLEEECKLVVIVSVACESCPVTASCRLRGWLVSCLRTATHTPVGKP